MALCLCPGFRTLSDDLLFCLRRLVRLRRVGVLTLYGLLELHFDRLKESLADACSWRLRIPRFVSRIPSRGHGRLILWLVSGNQPEPAVPDVESAKETALHSADHPLAHRILHPDVFRRTRKTFLGDGHAVGGLPFCSTRQSSRVTVL
jgi:hypothetical protein